MISIQLYSLREELEKDARGTLTALKEMGFDGVEPYGGKDLYGFSTEEFVGFMNELGLQIPSAHISYETLMEDTDGTLSFHRDLGCKYLAIPYLAPEKLPGGEAHDGIMANIQMLCERALEYGIQLCFQS